MAVNFNGSNQYAYADEAFSANNGSIDQTIAFFVKPQTLTATGYPIAVNDTTSDFSFFTARMEATSDIAGRHKTSASILTAYTTIANDAWTPIVVTFDNAGGTCTIYPGSVTGVSASGANSAYDWIRTTIGAALGAGSTPSDYFKGKVAYAMYFEREWTAQEISDFINATSVAEIDAISTTSRVFRYDLISDLNADGAGVGLTAVNSPTFDSDDPFAAAGPSITAADDITSEGDTTTVTLSGNSAAPTSITLNGTDVGTITDVGSGVYSYAAPLIADDETADLVVNVDGETLSTTIDYANSYDRDQLTHPATEAEYSENSLSYPNAYATSQPYEWKVVSDASASVVTIDWDALEADDGLYKDVANYATAIADGSTAVTLSVFIPETGKIYTFSRTIVVSDGEVDLWPFGKGIKSAATQNWTWGKRHPMTGMRVRIFK